MHNKKVLKNMFLKKSYGRNSYVSLRCTSASGFGCTSAPIFLETRAYGSTSISVQCPQSRTFLASNYSLVAMAKRCRSRSTFDENAELETDLASNLPSFNASIVSNSKLWLYFLLKYLNLEYTWLSEIAICGVSRAIEAKKHSRSCS